MAPSDFQNALLHTSLECFTAMMQLSALLGLWLLKNSQKLNATIDAVLRVSPLRLELKTP